MNININNLDLMHHKRIIAAAILGVFVLLVLLILVVRKAKKSKRQSPTNFKKRWQALTKLCASKKTWPQAIIDADSLLDEALTAAKYKGKTVGEKLVSAQRDLTDNEAAWFAHKYRTSIDTMDGRKITKKDVMKALTGFRQALRDLGALPK